MQFTKKHLFVARVISKDDPEFVTIEVMKGMDSTFTVQDGDEFLTMVFVRASGKPGEAESFDPFGVR